MVAPCISLVEACALALGTLSKLSELLGKRSSVEARTASSMLKRAMESLQKAVTECIEGCGLEYREARCAVGDILDRLVSVVYGVAVRLEKLGSVDREAKDVLEMLVDSLYGVLEAVCRVGEKIG